MKEQERESRRIQGREGTEIIFMQRSVFNEIEKKLPRIPGNTAIRQYAFRHFCPPRRLNFCFRGFFDFDSLLYSLVFAEG
jgi:hypothetical protein